MLIQLSRLSLFLYLFLVLSYWKGVFHCLCRLSIPIALRFVFVFASRRPKGEAVGQGEREVDLQGSNRRTGLIADTRR